MDRGSPRKAAMGQMRRDGVGDLVGTPKARLGGLEKELLDKPWEQVHGGMKVKLLEKDGELYVRIYVPETELGRIAVGQPVPVHVDTFPSEPFAGTVEPITMVGEYSPRNLQTAVERADQVFAASGAFPTAPTLPAGIASFIQVPH